MVPEVRSSELQVQVVNRRLVKASDHHKEPRADDVITVSNLDLIPNTYQASVLWIYPKPLTGDFGAVVAAFEAGLPSLLDHFFPLTGRIVTNPRSRLPEIHCRNQGAEFVIGEAGVSLQSLDFNLAEESLKRILVPYADAIPLSVQLVSFSCGGFSVAWSSNNLVLDGNSAMRLVRTWSELARSGTIAAVGAPSYDHSALRPRDPPSYSAALDEMFTPFDDRHLVNVLTAKDSVVERLYYIEAQDIATLQAMASSEGQRASRVQAVSAYLWKTLAAVVGASKLSPKATSCRMGWWVDARWRVTSPELRAAMSNYVGNVTPYVLGEAAVETIRQKTMADVAAMVRDAITSVDYDERVQELVDWVEEHKTQNVVETATVGLVSPTLSQRVWASFPLDTDFGFGHAALAMPTWASEGLCSANLVVTTHPGGNGSWLISADLWPRLAAALESDELRIFKPLTAEYLGV
ncbi:hypothetical protein BAE44_0021610 [Dichanthelium oligosanthes]|uniref:Omega-hydroxypalmitate O-feruloyl transferase n=1 Tax=Dichanthelium oligosanthes TaxID=888268 RepID=A0A1E5UWQ5_9POAL|nr:hypothetical protein BAE44_0021610 [Dichanthelium oligosanthes]